MPTWTRPPRTPAPKAAPAGLPPLKDPYARWAEATQWRAYQRSPGYGWRRDNEDKLRIIARAPDIQHLRQALSCSELDIPPLYHGITQTGSSDPLDGALHFTATLSINDLKWLKKNPLNLQWELATPLREALWTAQTDTRGRFGPQREELAFTLEAGMPPAPTPAPPTVARHSIRQALAVIDYGCPFLNPQFATADGMGTRIAALWDQQSGPKNKNALWWGLSPGAGYGRELSGAALQALHAEWRQRTAAGAAIEESTIYRGLGYLINNDDARRRVYAATHGAHVLDLAAGHPNPLVRLGASEERDPAGAAQLVFVQLPTLTAADSSGASLSAQLLDAVRYVLWVCHPDDPVVVNISYGSFAGPHDGSSLIETALAELLRIGGDRLQLVLSAGNARQANCHVKRQVQVDRSALLRLQVPPHDTTDTFLEIWYQPNTQAKLRVRARTADRDWSEWVLPEGSTELRDPATHELLALLQHDKPQGGASKALVLLSLAASEHAVNDEGPLNEPGMWEVEVAMQDDMAGANPLAVPFDAWIERDDPGDRGLGEQAHFLGLDRDDNTNTLSNLATTPGAYVAGGYTETSGVAAPYSSLPEPSTKQGLLMAWAVCEDSAERPGLLATAVRAGETFRMGGTSAAAPVLARQLYAKINLKSPRKLGQRIADRATVLQTVCDDSASFVRSSVIDAE